VRIALAIGFGALLLALPTSAAPGLPSAAWLVQARCVHVQEGPWIANTGNGYFGGMQFMAKTWTRMGGTADAAFAHPGDPAYPFRASKTEQLYRAWLLWKHDGGSWRSWGAVGTACA
jgi:resuscitation-promoting factor RpfA